MLSNSNSQAIEGNFVRPQKKAASSHHQNTNAVITPEM